MSNSKRTAKPRSTTHLARKKAGPPKQTQRVAPDADDAHRTGFWLYLHPSGISIPLHPRVDLDAAAMRWSYVLRNRARWLNGRRATDRQRADAVALLRSLVLDVAETEESSTSAFNPILAQIAAAEFVEVNIRYTREAENWSMRIVPWEYVVTAATYDERQDRALTVIRCLHSETPPLHASPPSRDVFLHLECVPESLGDGFDFESERKLVAMAAADKGVTYEWLPERRIDEIAKDVSKSKPRVIHVSGFDVHQARSIAPIENDVRGYDGFVVDWNENEPPTVLTAEALATTLVTPTAPPRLVSFNFYNSGARLAAQCVAVGAEASIGFQDVFNDRLAESFFAALYRAAAHSSWDLPAAFRHALSVITHQGRPMLGSGIILWTRKSLAQSKPATAGAIAAGVEGLPTLRGDQAANELDLHIKPRTSMNYSILHNNGSLFERFEIRRKNTNTGTIPNIDVRVELHVGADSFPFATRIELEAREATRDIAHLVKISLASVLSRSVHEAIRTTLFVEVACDGATVHRHTHRVTVLPIDEWRDDDQNRMWLPSFVLPRDPAVLRVIDSAQRYLMALRDDPSAGFDGYQALSPSPNNEPAEDCESIDWQVRAIWSALVHEWRLSYVNPPPTFTASSQRLRTPSDVIEGHRGTCIDLALLFAACLEYVDIYPAVILLRGHAYPVYWRSNEYFERFRAMKPIEPAVIADPTTTSRDDSEQAVQEWPWLLKREHYPEIAREIAEGRLVPVETVLVTGHQGFGTAVAEGIRNLTGAADFDGMLDVRLARLHAVTPLPIRREES